MPFQDFMSLFRDLGQKETRTATIFEDGERGLPADEYGFTEMYCNEQNCDCRRVFFYVVSRRRLRLEAVIAWGWEKPEFYAKWLKRNDPQMIAALIGPCLNIGSPATKLAPALLRLAQDVLLRDSDYVERIKRHYRMFRDKIDGGRRKKKWRVPRQR